MVSLWLLRRTSAQDRDQAAAAHPAYAMVNTQFTYMMRLGDHFDNIHLTRHVTAAEQLNAYRPDCSPGGRASACPPCLPTRLSAMHPVARQRGTRHRARPAGTYLV